MLLRCSICLCDDGGCGYRAWLFWIFFMLCFFIILCFDFLFLRYNGLGLSHFCMLCIGFNFLRYNDLGL